MIRAATIFLLSIFSILSLYESLPAQKQDKQPQDHKFIEFQKRFDDRAGILSEEELAAIEAAAQKQEYEIGLRAFLLIMPDIPEWDFDEFARDQFQYWKKDGIVDNKSYILIISMANLKFQPIRGQYIDEKENDYEIMLLRRSFYAEFDEGNYGNAIVDFFNGMANMPTLTKTIKNEKMKNQKAQWYMLAGIVILVIVFMRMSIKRRMEEKKREEKKQRQGPFIE